MGECGRAGELRCIERQQLRLLPHSLSLLHTLVKDREVFTPSLQESSTPANSCIVPRPIEQAAERPHRRTPTPGDIYYDNSQKHQDQTFFTAGFLNLTQVRILINKKRPTVNHGRLRHERGRE